MKKIILPLSLMVLAGASFAKTQVIPQALQDLREIELAKKGRFVLNDKSLFAAPPANWFNLSILDGVQGVGSEQVYREFGLPTSNEEIIVAVIDSGVDVNHEDLQGKIWINSDEIPNNGQDDDGNGYVDDVFGWNFIGGAAGQATIEVDTSMGNGLKLVQGDQAGNISADTLEVTRELKRMQKLKAYLESIGEDFPADKQAYLEKVAAIVKESKDAADETLAMLQPKLVSMQSASAILRNAGLRTIDIESVRNFETTDPVVAEAKATVLALLAANFSEARLIRLINHYTSEANFYYNTNFDPRGIVGDNYGNLTERIYGNNDVIGADASHGTHVSGIIAANRDNALGIKGVATNVKIMAVRVVPDGDERDKDVANGIRYAVDNGAKIINMSFGKAFSPFKKVVDEAVKYAESKGVLMVHAAGNSNQNNDTEANFPNRKLIEGRQTVNWLEIGASSYMKGETLPANFSNYGKFSVDIFAPGVDLLSSTPGNTYSVFSGTSMASPTTAGVAALVLSYNPSMGLADLRALIVDTSRRLPKLNVLRPGTTTGEKVLFSDLSINGSIADAYSAVKALNSQKKR